MLPKKIKGAVLFTGDNHLAHVKDNAPLGGIITDIANYSSPYRPLTKNYHWEG